MKPLLALLVLSLAANAALFVKRSRIPADTDSGTSSASASSSVEAARNTPSTAAASSSTASPGLTAEQSKHRLFWERLRAGDASAVEELRAAGWPASAIRSLVQTHIYSAFRDRIKALQPDAQKDEYWTARSMTGTPESQKAARALWREQAELLKKLLGSDYAGFNEEYSWRDQRFATLPPAQAESVRAIEDDYAMLTQEVRGEFTGGPNLVLPEDREKLAFLEKERRADLARILSPQELLEFELRTSPIAFTLRSEMEAFNSSEEEFRSIFSISQKTAERLNYVQPNGMWTELDQQNRKQLQTEVESQLKQLLGDQRFAEYTRAKDYEYRRLHQLTKRLDLPVSAANAAFEIKTDLDKRLREYKPAPDNKDPESIHAARGLMLDEADQQLKAALGPRGYEVYTANNSFVTNLRRSYAAPTRSPAMPAANAR